MVQYNTSINHEIASTRMIKCADVSGQECGKCNHTRVRAVINANIRDGRRCIFMIIFGAWWTEQILGQDAAHVLTLTLSLLETYRGIRGGNQLTY